LSKINNFEKIIYEKWRNLKNPLDFIGKKDYNPKQLRNLNKTQGGGDSSGLF
jgi:hypothetical protein